MVRAQEDAQTALDDAKALGPKGSNLVPFKRAALELAIARVGLAKAEEVQAEAKLEVAVAEASRQADKIEEAQRKVAAADAAVAEEKVAVREAVEAVKAAKAAAKVAEVVECSSIADYLDWVKRNAADVSYAQPALVAGKVLERECTREDLLNACSELAEMTGREGLDKTEAPIMATAGVGGSGKSTFLNLIRHGIGDEHWCPPLLAAIQAKRPAIKNLVVAMASMNQATTVQRNEEPMRALISRFVDNVTSKTWRVQHGQGLPQELSDLFGFAKWLRQYTGKGCKSENVAIMLLVDEVKKVGDVLGQDKLGDMLDALATFQQADMCQGFVSLVVVTSLDVRTIGSITHESQRPVRPIALPQLTSEVGLEACRVALEKGHAMPADMRFKIRANIRFALSASGGHLRTVHALMKHNFVHAFLFRGHACANDAVLQLLLALLRNPNTKLDENQAFGSMTIHDMASKSMLVYTDVDFDAMKLQVRLLPCTLMQFEHVQAGDYEQEAILLKGLMDRITQMGDLDKLWERAIPMAMELRGRALLYGGRQPTLKEVLPGVQIGYHANHKQLKMADIRKVCVCGFPQEVKNFTELQQKDIQKLACYVATDATLPGIELSVTSFLASRSAVSEATLVPFFFQMKLWRKVGPADLATWVEKAREATKHLCPPQACYIVLCASRRITTEPPPGVIYVDADVCVKLLEPFGASPLAQLIEERAAA